MWRDAGLLTHSWLLGNGSLLGLICTNGRGAIVLCRLLALVGFVIGVAHIVQIKAKKMVRDEVIIFREVLVALKEERN